MTTKRLTWAEVLILMISLGIIARWIIVFGADFIVFIQKLRGG